MKVSRFTEAQIMGVLRQAEGGVPERPVQPTLARVSIEVERATERVRHTAALHVPFSNAAIT